MDTLEITRDGRGITKVTLNRPEKHNAMSAQMIADLHRAATDLSDDDETRVIVLTGAGRSFCAGGDLGWMRDQMAADRATRAREARALADMLGAWNRCRRPVIGRVQGNAFGGGVGLMSVCDSVVAVAQAKFGLTETRLGLIPATIGPYVIARMGEGAARRVFMSARIFNAQEARDLGLVARVAASEDLDQQVAQEAEPYLACAPGAVAAAKALALDLGAAPDAAAVERSVEALLARWDGQEAAEGIAAFFEKRKPGWSGG